MKKFLFFFLALLCSATALHAQINLGAKPSISNATKRVSYDGTHNIRLELNDGSLNLKHLIGQDVIYIGINDRIEFNKPDPNATYSSKYKGIKVTPLKYSTLHVVDAGFDWLCLFEQGKTDSIFASGEEGALNCNLIVQKFYDKAKSCIGKTYRYTGHSDRIDLFRNYNTRRVYFPNSKNRISSSEDLKCIDVFVDTVHYDRIMYDNLNERVGDNLTNTTCRLCILFDTSKYGKIFSPVEESEVLCQESPKFISFGPALSLKKVQSSNRRKVSQKGRK